MKTLLAVLMFGFAAQCMADVYVPGYTKQDGTFVPGYHRTAPDNTRDNNYGSQGNVNPWTGKVGTADPNKPYTPKKGY